MLVNCPECELQVSDKAINCPHCGYPLKPTQASRPRVTSNKRRRLPNGFGQISEIKGKNLRKPFRAMVTVGKSESGRPICKPLKPQSYFETYNEAYLALVEYNRNPYDVNSELTMNQLYERWYEEYSKSGITDTWAKSIATAWKKCYTVHDIPVKDVRIRHLKGCLSDEDFARNMVNVAKSVLNRMFDYALEYDLTDKNYARLFSVKFSDKNIPEYRGHMAYSPDEMKLLWDHAANTVGVDMLLIQCYSGWRPQELLDLRVENINLDDMTFTGGMKTEAGKNRTIPIHSRIVDLVRKRYDEAVDIGSEYLFNRVDTKKKDPYNYQKYKAVFDKFKVTLGLNQDHRPHDGRKQFITMAKEYNVDEYAIKHLVGHSISDLTEKVYTERSIAWLKQEIEKIR